MMAVAADGQRVDMRWHGFVSARNMQKDRGAGHACGFELGEEWGFGAHALEQLAAPYAAATAAVGGQRLQLAARH